jgi:glycerol uptake facilitator-like aquaporin
MVTTRTPNQVVRGTDAGRLAIGFSMAAGAFAIGAISASAFKAVLSLGPAVMDVFVWPTLWVHLVAQTVGGLWPKSTNHKEESL